VHSRRTLPTNRSAKQFALGPGRDLDHLDALGGEHRVKRRNELGIPVADEESERRRPVAQVDHEVAGLLGRPFTGRVRGHAEDVDAAGHDFRNDEDVDAP
jgi:hypothetical protein